MSFAQRLNQAMDEKQMNQTELAAAIGKGKSSVSQYASGKVVPPESVQKKIAEVLGCTVEFLKSEVPDDGDIHLKNVPVVEAAKLLGKSPQFVRIALQTGVVPFGFAVKNKTKFSYYISPKKLAEYVSA